jgi:hypothetical protein
MRTTAFNGDPDAQHLSDAEYDERFAAADARYAGMLRVLINAFQAQNPSSETY